MITLLAGWLIAGCAAQDRSPIDQPYAYLCGGAFSGTPVPESPDPLVSYRWNRVKADDPLQVFVRRPVAVVATPPKAFRNTDSARKSSADITVKDAGTLRLDFGAELPAWIEFDSPDGPGSVEMSIGESSEPGVDKTAMATKHGGTYRLELNPELYDGVRFAWIRSSKPQQPWHITAIRAMCQVKPVNYLGSFHCSDPELTKIWYMAAYGVKAALCKDYFGSILMDRGDRMSWTGDAHPTQAAALVAFGNYDFVRQNLERTSGQDNGIRSYSLYWILSLLDYYYYTGDADFVEKCIPTACKKLDSAFAEFDKKPGLGFYGWDERLGAGFELWFRPCDEAQRAYRMLAIRAWSDFATAMGTLGHKDLLYKYRVEAAAKVAQLTATADWHKEYGPHAIADAINTGRMNLDTMEKVYERELKDRVDRLSFSPFNEFFILQALATLGKWDEALDTTKDMWGGMLRYGGTTPFEVYRPSWNPFLAKNEPVPNTQCGLTSLCHPWGAGIIKWLSENILGVTPTAPGFRTFDVRMAFGSKLNDVSGSVPTPHGPIRVSYNLAAGSGELEVPPQSVGKFFIPTEGRGIRRVWMDGKLVVDPVHFSKLSPGWAEAVTVPSLLPGIHRFKVEYVGHRNKSVDSKLAYQTHLMAVDSKTRGNWGGIYGREGYVLCGGNGVFQDVERLPSYVDSIDFFRAFPKNGRPDTTIWADATSDARALAFTHENQMIRRAASVSNTDQTMTATIHLKSPRKVRIALYFVDWNREGTRSAVELFDAKSLRLLAPVSLVCDHGNGRYLIYEVDRSVKFRFDKIRGKLVSLSGIFFDPVGR